MVQGSSTLAAPAAPAAAARTRYLAVLAWSFAFFNSMRVIAYLPTIWAICQSGDSQQHAALTWLMWTGANTTMAAWLYEQGGRQMTRAVAVNLCNAVMCLATLVVIAAYRF
jgi:hypothetical protein